MKPGDVGSGPVYEFGPYRLEISERRLLKNGRPVSLRAKVFDTLRVLVEHHGRLLHKEELLASVWPDANVEETNLSHNISDLRRVLERGSGQRYIETVSKSGYRFVAGVREVRPAAERVTAPAAAPAARTRS